MNYYTPIKKLTKAQRDILHSMMVPKLNNSYENEYFHRETDVIGYFDGNWATWEGRDVSEAEELTFGEFVVLLEKHLAKHFYIGNKPVVFNDNNIIVGGVTITHEELKEPNNRIIQQEWTPKEGDIVYIPSEIKKDVLMNNPEWKEWVDTELKYKGRGFVTRLSGGEEGFVHIGEIRPISELKMKTKK